MQPALNSVVLWSLMGCPEGIEYSFVPLNCERMNETACTCM